MFEVLVTIFEIQRNEFPSDGKANICFQVRDQSWGTQSAATFKVKSKFAWVTHSPSSKVGQGLSTSDKQKHQGNAGVVARIRPPTYRRYTSRLVKSVTIRHCPCLFYVVVLEYLTARISSLTIGPSFLSETSRTVNIITARSCLLRR